MINLISPSGAQRITLVQFAVKAMLTKAHCESTWRVTRKRASWQIAYECGPALCVKLCSLTKLVSLKTNEMNKLFLISFEYFLQGLLTHMEHMRMDPKHQFAAQYMLSRAAAERRERDTILAAAVAGGSSLLSMGQNSRGASPSAHSDTSSCNGRLSSPPPDGHHNQNDSGMNDNTSDNNNNTSGTPNSLSGSLGNYNGKLSVNDVLRSQTSGHLHQQYQQAVAAAAAGIAAQNQNHCNGLGSPGNPANSAAQAVVNLANAMRQSQPMSNGSQQSSPSAYHQNNQAMSSSHHHHHQAEVLLRSQAEAALRLAVSQAAAVVAQNGNGNEGNSNNQFRHHHNGASYNNHHQSSSHLQAQFTPDLSEALRLQEQRLEQALRLHGSELGLHQQHHQQQP